MRIQEGAKKGFFACPAIVRARYVSVFSLFNCLLEAHFSQAHEDEEMVRKFFVLLSLVGLR